MRQGRWAEALAAGLARNNIDRAATLLGTLRRRLDGSDTPAAVPFTTEEV